MFAGPADAYTGGNLGGGVKASACLKCWRVSVSACILLFQPLLNMYVSIKFALSVQGFLAVVNYLCFLVKTFGY